MTVYAKASIILMLGFLALPAAAEDNAGGPPTLARQMLPARGGATLSVTSDALTQGDSMNERFTQDGENRSPPLGWSKGPTGTRSYAILAEDSTVDRAEPVVHWVVYNIPFGVNRLAENQPKDKQIAAGAMQGLNVRNETGFLGPKPPAGQTHTYHMQVFALNTRLNLDPAETDRTDAVNAMKGHVLAAGDLTVTYTGK